MNKGDSKTRNETGCDRHPHRDVAAKTYLRSPMAQTPIAGLGERKP
ncbi:hypothetical protein [Laspinema olomoucense]|nr:hypothetical protein [Laspinema sp. D3c]MCT7995135.1 hypothetical protein [Laspinema sp. D3c]